MAWCVFCHECNEGDSYNAPQCMQHVVRLPTVAVVLRTYIDWPKRLDNVKERGDMIQYKRPKSGPSVNIFFFFTHLTSSNIVKEHLILFDVLYTLTRNKQL